MRPAILVTGMAALFLATGTAHANERLPEAMLGKWCQASVQSGVRTIFYRPSFAGRKYDGCVDFDDGITLRRSGFTDDRPIDRCDEYVFDKIKRTQGGYLVSTHCEEAANAYDPDEDDLAGTWKLQIVYDKELLIVTKMPEAAHAAEVCYEVQKTPDRFLALREYPTTKSKIVWALREDDALIFYDRALDEEDYRLQKNWKTWARVKVRYPADIVPANARSGWVYKKYIKEVPCKED